MKLILLLSFSLLLAKGPKDKPHGYEINGTMKGSYSGKIFLQVGEVKDTAVIVNGSFSFKGMVKDTIRAYMRLEGVCNIEDFYLENSKITMNVSDTVTKDPDGINMNNFSIDTIFGSKSYTIQSKFDKAINEISDKNYPDTVKADKVYEELAKFIKQHPAHPLSASYFSWHARDLPYEKVALLFSIIDTSLLNTVEGMEAKVELKRLKDLKFGNQIADFEEPSPDGKTIGSKQFRGKLLVVDFWASWCGPCRKQLPEVKRIYEEFHAKGLEMISVSLDSDRDKWLAAIHQEEMDWNNVSDLKGWQNQVALLYGVQSIPRLMLINKDGSIISPGLGPAELEQELKKRLP